VLSCHSQPSSLGAWRLGDIRQADRNFCTRQQQEKPKETSCKTGLLERPDYAEQSLKTSRKTAVINDKLKRFQMDIATLQET